MQKTDLWVLAALLLALLGCGSRGDERADQSAKDTIRFVNPGAFTFAASGEFRPFSYVDQDQQLAGFDVEVGEALAAQLGLRPSVLKYKFAAMVEGVKNGRFDAAVASHTVTPERRQHVAFTRPYYYSGPQAFARRGSPIRAADDLSGKEIAVSQGSTYSRIAAQYTAAENIKVYSNDVTALEALEAGRHDAVITDFVTGRIAIKSGIDVEGRVRLGRSEQAIAVALDNPGLRDALDEALKSLRDSGQLAALSRKYFDEDITETPNGAGDSGEASAAAELSADRAHPIAHFFEVLSASRGLFLEGAVVTVQLTVVSILVGSLIGLLFALLGLSRISPLIWLSQGYVYLVRGTPLIVQIFILYFGLTNIVKIPAFWSAALALGFHNGGYIAEIFRGAIRSIDPGQREAGLSLGMSVSMTYRRVILPQAMLRALPPLGNQFIIGLKDSSLAAFISMNELFNVATTQGANHFDQMTYLLVVAVYYLALVLALTLAVSRLETWLEHGSHE
ncbi:MAG: ABC transporter permease subunit [Haliangiales bacterium]